MASATDGDAAIEVRVHGQGICVGETAEPREGVEARCDLCGDEDEAVASVAAATYACAGCLRARLEAMSVARWRFRSASGGGLPWGKITS